MDQSGRRVLEVLCAIGIVVCLGSAVQGAFLRSEYVGDTRCYPALWQRNDRPVCADSNRRRDLRLLTTVAAAAGLAVTTRVLHRGRSTGDGRSALPDEGAPDGDRSG